MNAGPSSAVTTDAKWNWPMDHSRELVAVSPNSIIILMELFHWPRTIAPLAHQIESNRRPGLSLLRGTDIRIAIHTFSHDLHEDTDQVNEIKSTVDDIYVFHFSL